MVYIDLKKRKIYR